MYEEKSQANMPQRMSEVSEQTEQLSKKLSHLTELVDVLEESLINVLRPAGPNNEKTSAVEQLISVPFARVINEQNRKVENIIQHISQIKGRLEI